MYNKISLQHFAITDTTVLSDLVQTAYSQAIEFEFQPQLYFAQFSQQKVWNVADRDPQPGDQVTFTIIANLTPNTTPLSETADPTPSSMAETQVSITLAEYGDLVTTTSKLKTVSFANIDLSVAKTVGNSMGVAVDLIARTAYDASTNINYAGAATSLVTVDATHIITADKVRLMRTKLARENVTKQDGRFYVAIAHPDVIHDLRAETGDGSWRQPKEYVDPTEIYNGEIGLFEGFRWVESSNARIQADAGVGGTVDVYTTYFFGYQATGYAEGIAPSMSMSGPFDAMQRLYNVYWYGIFGFGILRAVSLQLLKSASSIGANT